MFPFADWIEECWEDANMWAHSGMYGMAGADLLLCVFLCVLGLLAVPLCLPFWLLGFVLSRFG